MRKLIKNKMLAMLLTFVVIMGVFPVSALAAESASDDEFKIVISMEGATLGQGFYVEPTAYTLDEINALVATKGYGPYTEETLTAAMATLAMLIDNWLAYEMTGTWTNSAYLASVKGIDKGFLNIPAFITENGGPSNDDNDGNDDDYLGEFDYSWMSGWMYTVNNFMCDVGCASWDFQNQLAAKSDKVENYGNTYVVRWQFTLYGYGSDLGFSTDWNTAYYEGANKDMLYAAYAECTNAAAKEAAQSVMLNLQATEEEVAAALVALQAATGTTTTGTTTTGTTTTGTTTAGTATSETTELDTSVVEEAQDDSTVSDDTLAQTIVDSVESLKITASSSAKKGSITVKWTVTGDTTYVEAFEIWKSTKKSSGFKKSFTTSSGTKRTYKNTKGLKTGTRYYYKVRAIAYVDGTKVKSGWSNKAYRKAK